ncbi:MAG: methionyl-tRNA formyltransferase [Patescibacteria group bacterium]|jgi:methionyl-tRNA formyltransferase
MFQPQNTKIVFLGTPNFAVPSLIKLAKAGYNIIGVVTQEDKPMGRKQIITPPPIKIEAQKLGLRIYQFAKIDEAATEEIKKLSPDLIIVVAYGQILPQAFLDIPKYGCLNIHPSLLPKYRGASPIQHAILNGDRQTGVTIMLLDAKMDHGPIIAQEKFEIIEDDDSESLSNHLACEGAEMLTKILPDYLEGKIQLWQQDHDEATFTKMIKNETAKIDWQKTPTEIERCIRAFFPWPGAWTDITGKKVKILKAHLENGELALDKVQVEGKASMSYQDYLRGNKPLL